MCIIIDSIKFSTLWKKPINLPDMAHEKQMGLFLCTIIEYVLVVNEWDLVKSKALNSDLGLGAWSVFLSG